jgi:hypothetical protein
MLISALDATRPFPERKWSLSVSQQARFPDFRLERVSFAAFPIEMRSVALIDGSLAIAGTQWREPCGLCTRFPCHPLWAPVTVNPHPDGIRVEKAIYLFDFQRTIPAVFFEQRE